MAKAICREYNVNYDYLVDGEGEMFSDIPDTILDELCVQYGLDDLDRSLLEMYLSFPPEVRESIKEQIRKRFVPKEKDPE